MDKKNITFKKYYHNHVLHVFWRILPFTYIKGSCNTNENTITLNFSLVQTVLKHEFKNILKECQEHNFKHNMALKLEIKTSQQTIEMQALHEVERRFALEMLKIELLEMVDHLNIRHLCIGEKPAKHVLFF